MTTPPLYSFQPVAIARTCFKTKFGIPRQPGLVQEARGTIRMLPPYNQPNTVRGLEDFSHLWLLFVFHEAIRDGWKATVRPPRLGGDKRIGVFASRSPFRPAPIGLSAVKLERIVLGGHGKVQLEVSGLDLLDGTPILDIKPYLPYADIIPDATGGFAPDAPDGDAIAVTVAPDAAKVFAALARRGHDNLEALARKMIAANPRPAYQQEPNRIYQFYLDQFEIIWQTTDDPRTAVITDVRRHNMSAPSEIASPAPEDA